MNLVKINASDYGLEENKAKQIEEQFKPMLAKMTELEKEYNEVIKLDINDSETSIKAYELRRKYVKVRTGTAEIHKAQKAFYLAGGRFVDGWKNAQIFASQNIEESLMNIEKHFENLEKEKIANLQLKRASELEKYECEIIPGNVGEMEESVWNNYLTGVKTNYENQKEAERKAEEERIENERINKLNNERYVIVIPFKEFWDKEEKELIQKNELGFLSDTIFNAIIDDLKIKKFDYDKEQERIRKENDRLKKEALAKEKKRIADEKIRKEREEKERKIRDKELQKEKEAREKIEKELQEKREAEQAEQQRLINEEKERKAAEKAAKLAPDKDKLIQLSNDITSFKLPEMSSDETKAIINEVISQLDDIVGYLNDKISEL